MRQREPILPLVLGLTLAIAAHLAVATAYATLQQHPDTPSSTPHRPNHKPSLPPKPLTPLPDLTLINLQTSQPRATDQTTTLTTTLKNLSPTTSAAAPFTLELAIDGQPIQTQLIHQPLPPNTSTQIHFQYNASVPGAHRIDITADVDRSLDESDEDNNTIAQTFIWLAPSAAQGIAPTDLAAISINTDTPRRAGQPVNVTAQVANLGATTNHPLIATLSLDGQPLETVALPRGLTAGQLKTLTWNITAKEPGAHDLTLHITDDNQPDANRSNDRLTRNFFWADPIAVGQEEFSPVRMNWIAYDDYKKLLARKSRLTQAAAQMTAEPTPQTKNTPVDPTPPSPPAPRTVTSITPTPPTTPPTPTTPAQPAQPQITITQAQPNAPKPPERAELKERTTEAPFIKERNSPVPVAAAPEELAPQAASRIAPVNAAEAERAQPITDTSTAPTADPIVSNPPVETITRREYAVRLPDLPANPATPDQTPILPTPSRKVAPSDDRAVRHSPIDTVAQDANPDDRSRAVAVLDDLPKPQTAALPLKPKSDEQPGSPQLTEPNNRPKDRTSSRPPTTTPDKTATPNKTNTTTTTTPAKPTPPTPPTPPAPRPMVANQPKPTVAPKVQREAPPVTHIHSVKVVPGKVIAQQGVVIQTIMPRISIVARMTSIPQNPTFEIIFDRTGHVIQTKVLTSTGHDTFDGPLLTSIYKWTIKPQSLHRIEDTLTLTVNILLREK